MERRTGALVVCLRIRLRATLAAVPGYIPPLQSRSVSSEALREASLDPPEPDAQQPDYCLVAVSSDDRLNLRVSLLARDINDRIRVTIRQFNPVLGHKIQEGLRYNCTAIS